ncbi:MAG: transglycosylase SLT domain-containing protein [Candidatus Gracilibacteria bacterium]|jgi:hypothetical protein
MTENSDKTPPGKESKEEGLVNPYEPLKPLPKEIGGSVGDYAASVAAILGAVGTLLSNVPGDEQGFKPKPSPEETPKETPQEPMDRASTESGPLEDETGEEGLERRHSIVGEIVRSQNYGDGVTTQENLDHLVEMFKGVFRARQGRVYYYGAKGELFLSDEVPANWFVAVETGKTKQVKKTTGKGRHKKTKLVEVPIMLEAMTAEEKTAWHNEHRTQIPTKNGEKHLARDARDLGYPFVATPVLPGVEPGSNEGQSLIEVVLSRLNSQVVDPGRGTNEGPRHLEGEKMRLYDAILKMADAYDIPHAVALGIAANESGYDRNAVSSANAYGIFQIQKGAYEDAKRYADKHPEFSGRVRKGALLGFKEDFHRVTEWKNRLVQAEMFCAYFRVIQGQLEEDVLALETRLLELDPMYSMGTLNVIAAITAYNAGPTRIKKTIRSFLRLNDDEIKEMIGRSPYGMDVWQAVLANSFGRLIKNKRTGKEGTTGVGPHVFTYASKVLAMGSLIVEEENVLGLLAKHGQKQYQPPASTVKEEPVYVEQSKGKSRLPLVGAALLSILGALVSAKQARKGLKGQGMNRRSFVQGAAALIGLGVPAARLLGGPSQDSKEEERVSSGEMSYETYPEAIEQGKRQLNKLFVELKESQQYRLVTEETNRLSNNVTAERVDELKPLIQEVFGKDWNTYLVPNSSNVLPALPADFFADEAAAQDEYLKNGIASGEIIPLEADNPNLPYFCQGLGSESGIKNNPEVMYVHKEFLPILGTLVVLVNHQIDAFNEDPQSFGMQDETFPKIPHITGIKLSGGYRRLKDRYAKSTKSFSDHWMATALDMISQGPTEGTGVVRFKEALVQGGTVLVPAGGKLPAQRRCNKTRDIVLTMVKRALFVLEDVLKANPGLPQILPRYEGAGAAHNWHVAMVPSRIAHPE